MTSTRTRTLADRRREYDGVSRQIAGTRILLAVAREHDLEIQVERIEADLADLEQHFDDLIQAAVEAGFTPEDFGA